MSISFYIYVYVYIFIYTYYINIFCISLTICPTHTYIYIYHIYIHIPQILPKHIRCIYNIAQLHNYTQEFFVIYIYVYIYVYIYIYIYVHLKHPFYQKDDLDLRTRLSRFGYTWSSDWQIAFFMEKWWNHMIFDLGCVFCQNGVGPPLCGHENGGNDDMKSIKKSLHTYCIA